MTTPLVEMTAPLVEMTTPIVEMTAPLVEMTAPLVEMLYYMDSGNYPAAEFNRNWMVIHKMTQFIIW